MLAASLEEKEQDDRSKFLLQKPSKFPYQTLFPQQ